MCLLSTLEYPNFFLHSVHSKAFCPVCDTLWVLKCTAWVNPLSHSGHSKGMLCLWVNKCFLRALAFGKYFLHCGHRCGVSFLCTNKCFLSWNLWTYSFGHTVHLYFLSSLCISLCFFRLDFLEYAFLHTLHLKGFSFEWHAMWEPNFLAFTNCFLQTGHFVAGSMPWILWRWLLSPVRELRALPQSGHLRGLFGVVAMGESSSSLSLAVSEDSFDSSLKLCRK